LELIIDYDIEVHYHPKKVNVMVDALSRKKYANELRVTPVCDEWCDEFEHLNLGIVTNVMGIEVTPSLEKDTKGLVRG